MSDADELHADGVEPMQCDDGADVVLAIASMPGEVIIDFTGETVTWFSMSPAQADKLAARLRNAAAKARAGMAGT